MANTNYTVAALPTPFFPMRPSGGSRFEDVPMFGKWGYEPKFDGWRTLIHAPTRQAWNRHGKPLSIRDEIQTALRLAEASRLEWLDCEVLHRRHQLGKGTLVVLDAPIPEKTYEERREILEARVEVIAPGAIPEEDSFVLTPSVDDGRWLWELLEDKPKPLYEGIVAKKFGSLYQFQTANASRTTDKWVKFRYNHTGGRP